MNRQAGRWKINHEQGMTIAEMMIVLAMTGVFSLFMGTELKSMADRVYLDTAVAELVGDLRYARGLAVREGEVVQVAVGSGQPGVTLFRASIPGQPVAPTRNLMSRGIRAIRSTGGHLLSFHPRGTSATPTTLTLEDGRGTQRVVTVSLTGIVRAR